MHVINPTSTVPVPFVIVLVTTFAFPPAPSHVVMDFANTNGFVGVDEGDAIPTCVTDGTSTCPHTIAWSHHSCMHPLYAMSTVAMVGDILCMAIIDPSTWLFVDDDRLTVGMLPANDPDALTMDPTCAFNTNELPVPVPSTPVIFNGAFTDFAYIFPSTFSMYSDDKCALFEYPIPTTSPE